MTNSLYHLDLVKNDVRLLAASTSKRDTLREAFVPDNWGETEADGVFENALAFDAHPPIFQRIENANQVEWRRCFATILESQASARPDAGSVASCIEQTHKAIQELISLSGWAGALDPLFVRPQKNE